MLLNKEDSIGIMEVGLKKLLKTIFITVVMFGFIMSEVYGQVNPSEFTAEAQTIQVCSGDAPLKITFVLTAQTSDAIQVKVKLADGVEYVPNSAVLQSTSSTSLSLVEDVSNPNEPVFKLTSATSVVVGTRVSLSIKRQALCEAYVNAVSSGETGFVFKDAVTVITNDRSETTTSNLYNVTYPSLTISQPAAQNDKVIGETINREFSVTNGSDIPADRFFLLIDYGADFNSIPSLQVKLEPSGSYQDLSPSSSEGSKYRYEISGAMLGSDAKLTNGERVFFKETFILRTCAPSTLYSLGWGCSADSQCRIENSTGTITMLSGVPNIGNYVLQGPDYNKSDFSVCEPFYLTFSCQNNGTGGVMGAACNIRLTGKNDIYTPRGFRVHKFVEIETLTGTKIPNEIVDGSELLLLFENKFNFDPDGPGGLTDVDGDGYFDDLPVNEELHLKYKVQLKCDAFTECGNVTPNEGINDNGIDDNGLAVKVGYHTVCDKTTWKEPSTYHWMGVENMCFRRRQIVDLSRVPENIEKDMPFDLMVRASYYSITNSYNLYNSNNNSHYVIEIDIPNGLTLPNLDGNVLWGNISSKPTPPGVVLYNPLYPLEQKFIKKESESKLVITSPSCGIGYVLLKGLTYDCTQQEKMKISYRIKQVFNHNYPNCICPEAPILCGSKERIVLGCRQVCEGGPETGAPIVEREDESLGWVDYKMLARQSRSQISSYDLAKAVYKDKISLRSSAVQHKDASSLGARLRLKLGTDGEPMLTPLSAQIIISRGGATLVDQIVNQVNTKKVGTSQQIDWDFSSLVSSLPEGILKNEDKVDVITHYQVDSENGYLVDTPVGEEWFFYNSDTTPVWDTQNPVLCLSLVPEMYIMGTDPRSGCDPYKVEGCIATDLGVDSALGSDASNYYGRRFGSGAFKYENEYRPGMKLEKVHIDLPSSYTLNSVTYLNPDNHESGISKTFIPLTPEGSFSEVSHGGKIYKRYTYSFPNDNTSHFALLPTHGARLKANVSASCGTLDKEAVSFFLDYIDYYHYAASHKELHGSIPQEYRISSPLDPDISSEKRVADLASVQITYDKKPAIELVDQSGELELVGKNGEWRLQVTNNSKADVPYVWLALPNISGLVIDEVVTGGVSLPFTPYPGGKMYRLSNKILSSESKVYTIKFTYSGCSSITLQAVSGWNCTEYPTSPEEYLCGVKEIALKLKPLKANMELAIQKDPCYNSQKVSLCSPLEYVCSINSTAPANLYNPSLSIFPEVGIDLPATVEVQYPAGTGSWETINLENGKVNLMEHSALKSIGYLKGITEAGSELNERKLIVKFEVNTTCDFVSGKSFTLRPNGVNACDASVDGAGIITSTLPIHIDGVIVPYNTNITSSLLPSSVDDDCKTPRTLKFVHTISGSSPSSDNAYFEIILPLGFRYVNASYAPENSSEGQNAMSAGAEVSEVLSNGQEKLKVGIKSGLSNTTFAYTLKIKEDDTNPPTCGNHKIKVINVEKIAGLECGGTQCSDTYVVTGTDEHQFSWDKPSLNISIVSAESKFSKGKENVSIKYTVSNSSDIPLKVGTIVTLFSDKDNNLRFSTGDEIIITQELLEEVTNIKSLTQIIEKKGVDYSLTNDLVLSILPKDGCYCDITVPRIVLFRHPRNYWMGGTIGSLNSWDEPNNWTNNRVPSSKEDIEFSTNENNPLVPGDLKTGPAKQDLHAIGEYEIGNLINDSDKDLVITVGGLLTIDGKVEDNNEGKGTIVVQSLRDKPTGTLLFADPGSNQDVKATVEFYNKGYYCSDCGMYPRSWQYFGIPVKEASFPYDDVSDSETINQWVEPFDGIKWQPAPYTPDMKLKKFKGYQITNSIRTVPTGVYRFQDALFVGDALVDLSYTNGVNYSGVNLIGNSYTAAIDIKQSLILPEDVEKTVYLFNTGTRDQWCKLDGSTINGYRAGQYLAVPQNAAGLMNLPDRIPSMHAFLLRRMNSNNATSVLKIDYKKLVKNTLVNNGNGSLIAWRSTENTSRRPSLILDVIGNGTADRLWIFTKPGMTFAFDNGWDGKKLLEKDISQLYVMENVSGDRFQVAAVPQLDSLLIGFDAAKEGEYVLEFSLSDHFSMNSILLQDLHTGVKQSLTDGDSYVFEAKKGDSGARFRLLCEDRRIDTAESSLLVEQIDKRILITNDRNQDYTAFIYSVDGKLLQCISVKAKEKIATETLMDGVYVVSLRSSDMVDEARKVMIN